MDLKYPLISTICGLMMIFGIQFALAVDLNANRLISDTEFVDINSMSVNEIQAFLENKGSYLASFTENSRTAAQIIWDASHGYGAASGECTDSNGNRTTVCLGIDVNSQTGTVSPKVLLVTLQKEQSLLTKSARDDNALSKAMGYACPDSGGCNSAYAGFTKQVENGAWQLRFNYERAQGYGYTDYQVGQTVTFSNSTSPYNPPATQQVTLENRATSSLYRYTPHVYNGNYNFHNLYYNTYSFGIESYANQWVSQSNYQINAYPGETLSLSVSFKNIGSEDWSPEGQECPVRLAVHDGSSLASESLIDDFKHPSWVNNNRVVGLSSKVTAGSTGTFNFNVTVPSNINPGTRYFVTRLVAEQCRWFSANTGAWWQINIAAPQAQWVDQSAHITVTPGDAANLSLTLKNTGLAAWSTSPNPVRLAVHNEFANQSESFMKQFNPGNWLLADRVAEIASNVASGGSYTFNFPIRVPTTLSPGEYYFAVRPVSEDYQWFPTDQGAWWRITVGDYQAQWVNQSDHPTISRGSTADLWVTFRNTGTATWYQSLVNNPVVRLAVNKDRNESVGKQFVHSSWLSSDRIAGIDQSSVAPGTTATFRFTIAAPSTLSPGVYRLYVRPVGELNSWFEDADGAWWDVTVQ